MTAGLSADRVVVLAPNWLGDVIMALPALTAVRQWFPSAHVAAAARAAVADVVRMTGVADEVVALQGRGAWRDGAGRAADAARLRDGRFDIAILLPNSFHAAWLVWRAGIGQRWGYRRDARGLLLTRAPAPPGKPTTQAAYYAGLVRALGGPDAVLTAALQVDQAARESAAAMLRAEGWGGEPLVAFAPGAAFGPAKRWPADRVAAVAVELALTAGVRPVLVGTAADRDAIAEVQAHYRRAGGAAVLPAIDLGGRTDLPALAGVFTWCGAVLSNDSGAMHLAAAAGAAVTAVFGPTDEDATAPLPHPGAGAATVVAGEAWCRPCLLRRCPIDHRCMTSIDPARVAATLAAAASARRAGGPRP